MAKNNEKEQRLETDENVPAELPAGVKLLRILEGHHGAVMSLAFDPQGRTLASGSADKTIKLWKTHSGELLRTLERSPDNVAGTTNLAFNPENDLLATASSDGRVEFWEVGSYR